MGVLNGVRSVFFVFLLLLSAQSVAAGRMDRPVSSFDNEDEEKPWAESEVQLPAFPENENLIAFKVGAVDDIQYAVDRQSVSVGADDVIRFALVITSSMGAKSISYEGIRCVTGERRFYASGRSDKTWSKARSNQWVKIAVASNSAHFELYSNYFCTYGTAPVASIEDALRVLRRGGNSGTRR